MSFLGLDEKELKDLGFDNGQLGGIRFTLGVLKNAKGNTFINLLLLQFLLLKRPISGDKHQFREKMI